MSPIATGSDRTQRPPTVSAVGGFFTHIETRNCQCLKGSEITTCFVAMQIVGTLTFLRSG